MSQQIILQPNGRYAVWSTIVGDFVLVDATPADMVDFWTENERQRITRRVNEIISALARGEKPYCQFTMTWQEARERRRDIHQGNGESNDPPG